MPDRGARPRRFPSHPKNKHLPESYPKNKIHAKIITKKEIHKIATPKTKCFMQFVLLVK